MLRIQHWNKAIELVRNYDGSAPLHHYLKQYFSANKKHGSKDRKTIGHLCYTYYRIGCCLKELPVEERLKISIFLTHNDLSSFTEILPDELLRLGSNSQEAKIKYLQERDLKFSVEDIFSFKNELSADIEFNSFNHSHLHQPDVFLRIRPEKENIVAGIINTSGTPAVYENDHCLRLPSSIAVDQLFSINKDVVVQDYSSQRIAEFITLLPASNVKSLTMKVWDCCAGSGGKSLLAADILKKIDLTVSDVRPSIIQNLTKRFKEAGLSNYRSFYANLTQPSEKLPKNKFDFIICDAPCSGSGTWGRMPEQLYFFSKEKISYYTNLQKQITATTSKILKPGGYFLYITCSVFTEENESMVRYLQSELDMKLIKQGLLKGYDKKADTMFAALFTA
ncbi:MAG: Fmu (Sun) protein [Chitinophagaceae bacterium]|nr:Fmu (Sun) protein [Chitinophagaceae bacterium]